MHREYKTYHVIEVPVSMGTGKDDDPYRLAYNYVDVRTGKVLWTKPPEWDSESPIQNPPPDPNTPLSKMP